MPPSFGILYLLLDRQREFGRDLRRLPQTAKLIQCLKMMGIPL